MKTIKPFSLLPYFLFLGIFLTGCVEDSIEIEEVPFEYYTQEELDILDKRLNLPAKPNSYVLATGLQSPKNRMAVLGRVLFYDKHLSSDLSVSCASCHDQTKGFADDVAFSEGPENRKTARNSIAIGSFKSIEERYNSGSGPVQPRFFWDERTGSMEEQMEQTINNPDEMGLELNDIVDYIKTQEDLKILHRKAFGTNTVRKQDVLQSLKFFINSIRSEDSKFDHAIVQSNSPNLNNDFSLYTSEENLGKAIFLNSCNSCHGFSLESRFGSSNFNNTIVAANNGLDMEYEDKGVGSVTNKVKDNGVFKIPGLRNVSLTGPYMHDGRFETLEDVVDFYNDGVVNHTNLHEDLKSPLGEVRKMNLTTSDKAALVSFLKTLTDESLATDQKYSDPFLN